MFNNLNIANQMLLTFSLYLHWHKRYVQSCFHLKKYECIWSHTVTGKLMNRCLGTLCCYGGNLAIKKIETILEQTENMFCLYSSPKQ